MIFSLYGVKQINDKWFTQGVVSFGSAKVKGSEKRFHTNTITEIAKARYNSTSYAGDFIAGYNHLLNNNVVINPIGGLGYTLVNDKRYKESGTTHQNLDVTRKASQRLELIAGLRGVFRPFNINNTEVTTELHSFVRHDLIGKDPKVQIKHEGASKGTGLIPVNKSKTNRTFYSVGTSINAIHGLIEYGAGYDLNLSKKYVGHQGSLKLRVNF
jgi:outer membrane autotransporter protein